MITTTTGGSLRLEGVQRRLVTGDVTTARRCAVVVDARARRVRAELFEPLERRQRRGHRPIRGSTADPCRPGQQAPRRRRPTAAGNHLAPRSRSSRLVAPHHPERRRGGDRPEAAHPVRSTGTAAVASQHGPGRSGAPLGGLSLPPPRQRPGLDRPRRSGQTPVAAGVGRGLRVAGRRAGVGLGRRDGQGARLSNWSRALDVLSRPDPLAQAGREQHRIGGATGRDRPAAVSLLSHPRRTTAGDDQASTADHQLDPHPVRPAPRAHRVIHLHGRPVREGALAPADHLEHRGRDPRRFPHPCQRRSRRRGPRPEIHAVRARGGRLCGVGRRRDGLGATHWRRRVAPDRRRLRRRAQLLRRRRAVVGTVQPPLGLLGRRRRGHEPDQPRGRPVLRYLGVRQPAGRGGDPSLWCGDQRDPAQSRLDADPAGGTPWPSDARSGRRTRGAVVCRNLPRLVVWGALDPPRDQQSGGR